MSSPKAFVFILLFYLVGCSPLVDPDNVPENDTLVVKAYDLKKVEVSSIKGDGISQTKIVAQLPAESGVKDVTFTTTGGRFVYSNDKSIKELADSVNGQYRFARVLLQADTLKQNAPSKTIYITVEVGTTRKRLPLVFSN